MFRWRVRDSKIIAYESYTDRPAVMTAPELTPPRCGLTSVRTLLAGSKRRDREVEWYRKASGNLNLTRAEKHVATQGEIDWLVGLQLAKQE